VLRLISKSPFHWYPVPSSAVKTCRDVLGGVGRYTILSQPANQAFAIPGPKNKCCFCVYPSEGERDHEAFGALCGKCLESAFSGCTVSQIFSAKDFTPKAIEKYNCEGTINQLNIQHGPKNYVTSQVRVCKTAYPECSINFNDASCATFQDEQKARKYIDEVRRLWKGSAEIKLCASRSINFFAKDCGLIRQEITYNISNSGVTEDLGECPSPGSNCMADGRKGTDQKEFRCRNSGSIFTQECCLIAPGKSS